ncbi:MAG: ATP synthase F1 subunit delta [Clostridia bacterium]|nr:ATP synthase F1 subunit delta [Clostridia bacterium]MBO7503520.1 ATP synthase F1 subunit delta [Clostridia bacterium]MBO7657933.1 ATP synthase F1 subunit delta [Clostridia bacterium]
MTEMIDAGEYGKALLLLTEERGTTESVLADTETVSRILCEFPKYATLADTPALPTSERLALVGEAFSGLDTDLVSLLKILCEKREFFRTESVLKAYREACDEVRGIERVTAVTAVPMSESQLGKLREKLEAETGRQIVIKNVVDPSVLGGINLRYGGIQRDGSLKAALARIKKALLAAKV